MGVTRPHWMLETPYQAREPLHPDHVQTGGCKNTSSLTLPSPAPSDEETLSSALITDQSIYVDGRDDLNRAQDRIRAASLPFEHPSNASQKPSNKRPRGMPDIPSSTTQRKTPQFHTHNSSNELQRLAYSGMAQFVRSCGGHRNIPPKPLSRINLLQEASIRVPQDVFYLVVHQVLSVAYLGAAHLPPSVLNVPNVDRALEILNGILSPLEGLDYYFIHFFACFPVPIKRMITWRTPYGNAMTPVVNFLAAIVRHYPDFERQCRNRNAPPLVEELIELLGLRSPILQRVFFLAIMRRIWPAFPTSAEPIATGIFQDNLYAYLENRQTSSSNQRNIFLEAYADLYDKAQAVAKLTGRSVSGQRADRQCELIPGIQPQAGGTQLRQNPRLQIDTRYTPQSRLLQISPYSAQTAPQHFLQRPEVQGHAMQNQHLLVDQTGYPSFQNPSRYSVPTANPAPNTRNSLENDQVSWLPHATLRSHCPNRSDSTSKPTRKCFFPRPEERGAQVTPPEPDRYALHQAHLRSPVPRVAETARNTRLYQYVANFAMMPKAFSDVTSIHEWHFAISDNDFLPVPLDRSSSDGAPLSRMLTENSLQYRLRCISHSTSLDISNWVVADTKWPSDVYFSLNGVRLHPRKKLHNGRDLAIDITSHIRKDKNTVKILSNKRKDVEQFDYAVAVEIVRLKNHADVKAETVRRMVPVEQIKATIITSLKSRMQATHEKTDDDDEITVLSNTMTISLMDPYKGIEMFDIPARGATCRHRDCFDLETFLQTRPSKASGEPTRVDVWKCPICGADARPCSLVVDGYLAEVRSVLEAVGQLGTAKAIMVGEDAMWRVKNEEIVSHEHRGRNKDRTESSSTKTIQVDVVDLEMD